MDQKNPSATQEEQDVQARAEAQLAEIRAQIATVREKVRTYWADRAEPPPSSDE